MDTILKKHKLRAFLARSLHTVGARFLESYLVLLAATLVLLNTLPTYSARRLTFSSKQRMLQGQVSVIASSLAALNNITEENVTRVMRLLEVEGVNRVCVSDADGVILYDVSDRSEGCSEKISWALRQALNGNDAFYSRFTQGQFRSSAASPVVSPEGVRAAVFLYDADPEQGQALLNLRHTLLTASIAIGAAAAAFSILFSDFLSKRFRRLLKAVRNVRDGNYSTEVRISGKDELSYLSQEFNSLTERLRTTEEARRRFISDASHELKTPLASIRLLSDSILQTPDVDRETVTEFVRDIGGEAQRLARTTEKLLNLTRHDNHVVIPKDRVNLNTAVRGVIQILNPIAAQSGVTLQTVRGSDCWVLATEDDLYQIALNLAENAIKYNVPGGSVLVETDRVGEEVVLTVSDTGIGIPEASLEHIFDRFYRVDKARSRETGGSGLGLSIVKATAEEHGGSVTAERKPEGGMRFTVRFPWCPPEE